MQKEPRAKHEDDADHVKFNTFNYKKPDVDCQQRQRRYQRDESKDMLYKVKYKILANQVLDDKKRNTHKSTDSLERAQYKIRRSFLD